MLRRSKLWKLLFVIIGVLILILLGLLNRPSMPVTEAVAITITAETNLPASDRKFRLFILTNRANYDIRWHGDGIEIEGRQGLQGRIVNKTLPGATYLPVLKSGQSLQLWIGEPFYSDEPGQWRFTTSFTKYDLRERWHDQAMKGKLPIRVGRLVLVDSQKILNPTNYKRVTSEWITNKPTSPK